jgi:Transposase and inactivated derivatives
VVLRQQHRAGEKVFVDFCDGISLIDADTSELVPTQLFVGALGASSYIFAIATLSQDLPVWLDCHVRMYEHLGGVAALTIPDNLRSGVSRPDRYEADINPSYRELVQHYGTCVIPARIRKRRDKAKVEAALLVAQRWILAALRHRTFYHLNELNAAIGELLVRLNDRMIRHVKSVVRTPGSSGTEAAAGAALRIRRVGQARVNINGVRKVWRQLRREGFDVGAVMPQMAALPKIVAALPRCARFCSGARKRTLRELPRFGQEHFALKSE